MFLDEELYQIGKNTKLTEKDVKKSVNEMIKLCFGNLIKNINDSSDEGVILANFKRVNKIWEIVADKLEKDGKGFIKKDGFRLIVNSDKNSKGLLPDK